MLQSRVQNLRIEKKKKPIKNLRSDEEGSIVDVNEQDDM